MCSLLTYIPHHIYCSIVWFFPFNHTFWIFAHASTCNIEVMKMNSETSLLELELEFQLPHLLAV